MMENHSNLPPAVIVGGLTILRCLGTENKNIPLVLATSVANKSAFSSCYVDDSRQIPGPTNHPDEFVDHLCELGETYTDTRPVLYYDGDADLLCVSRNRERLKKHFDFLLPGEDVVEKLLDKSLFRDYAIEKQLPVPASFVLAAGADFDTLPDELCFPLLIKPVSRVGWFLTEAHQLSGGGKAIKVGTQQELQRLLDKCRETGSDMLIQRLVEGGEENIVSYHSYVDADGTLLGEYCGRKHRTYPVSYGLSSCVEVCDLPRVKEIGRDVLEKTGLTGVSKMDFKIDANTGEIFLLEINPRYSIWNYPAAVYGVNLPLIAYRDQAGLDIELRSVKAFRPVKWIDGNLDFMALKQRSGSLVYALTHSVANCFERAVYNVWSWKDPGPLLHEMRELFARAVRKLYRVLSGRKLFPGKDPGR